jgi:hypothetical protein
MRQRRWLRSNVSDGFSLQRVDLPALKKKPTRNWDSRRVYYRKREMKSKREAKCAPRSVTNVFSFTQQRRDIAYCKVVGDTREKTSFRGAQSQTRLLMLRRFDMKEQRPTIKRPSKLLTRQVNVMTRPHQNMMNGIQRFAPKLRRMKTVAGRVRGLTALALDWTALRGAHRAQRTQ